MKSFILPVAFAVLISAIGYADTSESSRGWNLVWSDEFNGPAGQSPDPAKWGYDIGTDWGNAQLEYDTDRPVNVSLDGNGNLAITAREESYLGQPYTSARIVTRGLYEPTYARVAARIKLPVGQGIWPAFWMLGTDINTVGWPQCGEIDIMEFRGQQPGIIYGSLHGPGYSADQAISQSYILPDGQFNDDFHLFAVEWEENLINWYVDDVLYHTTTPEYLAESEWVFNHPFYIILNVAVGGNFVGPPDPTTAFPQTMLIDYVRVYQKNTQDYCCRQRGDADGSGSVSISDAVYIIEYIFGGGLFPECLDEADADGDESISISDAVYLINFIFDGGPTLSDCPAPPSLPLVPAPTPTIPAADVISIFSDTYADVSVDTWSADWDMADVSDYMIGADNTKKYTGLIFAGIEFATNSIDASAMTHFHIDVWTPDPTAMPAVFKVKLVDFGANGVYGGGDDVEHEVSFDENTMSSGRWISIDVPLSEFTDLTTKEHLAQLLISGDPSTVYIDNVFLHR